MSFRLGYLYRSFLRTHLQTRSLLALFCLGISIATLMQVLAVEAGARRQMQVILGDTGNRNLTISAGTVSALPNRGSGISMAVTLTPDDYDAIAQAGLPVSGMAAVSSATRSVEYRELAIAATITGTQPHYFKLRNFQLAQGWLFEDLDDSRQANVAVLGAQVAAVLFGADQEQVLAPQAINGNTVLISGIPFEVIGVLSARGNTQSGMSEDEGVFIPLSTALRRVFNVAYFNSIVVGVTDISRIAQVRDSVTILLSNNHASTGNAEPDFTVLDATRALAAAARNRQFTDGFFRGFALLTLGMAGIGIFAVNHLNVKERDSEFGLRRAVGARTRDIALLVLGETLLLGLAGGAVGIASGLLVLVGIRALTTWVLLLDALILLQVLGAAILLSMLAALAPAWKAATKNPLAALNRL